MLEKKCPECFKLMKKETRNWVEIDICNSCQWMFLEYWEIGEIINHTSFNKVFETIQKWDFKKDNINKDIICSSCKIIMEEREYIYWSWNHINFCKKCKAIYLDKWELDDIQNYEISRINSKEWREILSKIEMEWRKASIIQKNTFKQISDDDSKHLSFFYWLISKFIK